MIGVSYHPRDRLYEPRIKFAGKTIWLKTFHRDTDAARVRDVAAKWIQGPNAQLNYPNHVGPPDGITEAHIARWLWEGGVPLKILAQRIPLKTLLASGATHSDLIAAGVDVKMAIRA